MISTIKEVVFWNLKKMNPQAAIDEGLVRYDFELSDRKTSLMQICFSPLASLIVTVLLVLICFSPLRYHFSLFKIFGGESPVVLFLFQSTLQAQSIVFVFFYFMVRFFRFDFVFICALAWVLSNGDIHIVLAQAGLLGIFLAQLRYQSQLIHGAEGAIGRIIRWVVGLQFIGFGFFIFFSSWIYATVRGLGFFESSIRVLRVEYFIFIFLIYQLLQFFLLSVWGHFYARKVNDPTVWDPKYSVVRLLPLMRLSNPVSILFENKVNQIAKDRSSQSEANGLSEVQQKMIPLKLLNLKTKEDEFLKLAQKMIVPLK